jgi:hypothetical protein
VGVPDAPPERDTSALGFTPALPLLIGAVWALGLLAPVVRTLARLVGAGRRVGLGILAVARRLFGQPHGRTLLRGVAAYLSAFR